MNIIIVFFVFLFLFFYRRLEDFRRNEEMDGSCLLSNLFMRIDLIDQYGNMHLLELKHTKRTIIGKLVASRLTTSCLFCFYFLFFL